MPCLDGKGGGGRPRPQAKAKAKAKAKARHTTPHHATLHHQGKGGEVLRLDHIIWYHIPYGVEEMVKVVPPECLFRKIS